VNPLRGVVSFLNITIDEEVFKSYSSFLGGIVVVARYL
jgi:hypothetical protein